MWWLVKVTCGSAKEGDMSDPRPGEIWCNGHGEDRVLVQGVCEARVTYMVLESEEGHCARLEEFKRRYERWARYNGGE
jgi:hypothetical protein